MKQYLDKSLNCNSLFMATEICTTQFINVKLEVLSCAMYTWKSWLQREGVFRDWQTRQDGRLEPAYFSPTYKVFYQRLQTVEKREYCFESSFQRFSGNISSTTDFYNAWHYRLTRPLKQNNKPEIKIWITFWKLETILWDHDSGNPTSTFRVNEFDPRDKPLPVALLPYST